MAMSSSPCASYRCADIASGGFSVAAGKGGDWRAPIFSTVYALAQKSGGSIVCITAALADNPISGSPASVAMMTKGGLNAAVKSLSSEYAKEHIRFNAVAPGVVDSPLHAETSPELLARLTPMASISTIEDVADAVLYLTEARQITGEILHVDGGAHIGKW